MCQRTVHAALSGVTSRDVSENFSRSIVRCYMEGCVREWFTQYCLVLHRGMCQRTIHWHCQVLHRGMCQRTVHAAFSGVTLRDVSENGSRSIVRCYIEGCVREQFTQYCQVLHRGMCQRTIHWHCQVLHRGMCQRTIHAVLSGVTLRDVSENDSLALSGVTSRDVSENDSLALSGVTSRDVSVNGSRSIVRCYIEGCVREWFTWHCQVLHRGTFRERFTWHCQVLHRGTCQRTIHSTLSGVTSRDVWPEFREMFQVVHGNLRCKIIADMEFVT